MQAEDVKTLEDLCNYILFYADRIYVMAKVGCKRRSYALTELPPRQAIEHALIFIKEGRIPQLGPEKGRSESVDIGIGKHMGEKIKCPWCGSEKKRKLTAKPISIYGVLHNLYRCLDCGYEYSITQEKADSRLDYLGMMQKQFADAFCPCCGRVKTSR